MKKAVVNMTNWELYIHDDYYSLLGIADRHPTIGNNAYVSQTSQLVDYSNDQFLRKEKDLHIEGQKEIKEVIILDEKSNLAAIGMDEYKGEIEFVNGWLVLKCFCYNKLFEITHFLYHVVSWIK